ncbi:MAG: menaquinone biosynthesis protein [Nitrospirae bacterium]|nr:menaquinone biosynthesis protein [Nitrospirota bacterium]
MLKIGRIPYANLYPIYSRLEKASGGKYEFIDGVPSDVNRLLREGLIDISPSSSVEYLRRPEKYILIEGHSVSSEGPVGSILLFSRVSLGALDGRTVLYTRQSETSVALLRIVLSKFYGQRCTLESSERPLKEALGEHAAYLLIGDDALREARGRTGLFIYDLGEIWHGETGLPFVFALWMANKSRGAAVGSFRAALDEAKDEALGNLPEIARTCPLRRWLSEERLVEYWRRLSYGFDEHHRRGLELFGRYIEEMGT